MIHARVVRVKNIKSAVVQMLNISGSAQEVVQTLFNKEQREAITHNEGPMLCVGTPGSGKTTVIVHRIKYLIEECKVKPENILVITFTKDAALMMEKRAGEILSKDEAGSVRFGTFHSFFFWVIRTAYSTSDITVLGEDERFGIIKRLIISITGEKDISDDLTGSVIRQLDLISSDMIDISNYYSSDMSTLNFAKLYHEYTDYKRKSGRIDFNDMTEMCYRLLSERDDIKSRLRALYPYVMVDEFQDTNRIQYETLKLLTGKKGNTFVVGDDDQSIYGFRGASPDILFSFEKEYKNVKRVILPVNYRCPKRIVDAADKLIGKNKKRFEKKLISGKESDGHIELIIPEDPSDEALRVVENIRADVRNGKKYGDIAVLYRTNQSPIRLLHKFKEFDIPFAIKDRATDIFSSLSVSIVLDYMAFVSFDRSRERFLRIMNKPVRYIERGMLKGETVEMESLLFAAGNRDYLRLKIISFSNHLHAMEKMNPFAMANYIRKAIGVDRYLMEYAKERNMDYEDMKDSLDEFMSIVSDFDDVGSLFNYIEDIKELTGAERVKHRKTDADAVSLMTFHGAKGLEWDSLHIIEAVEGEIPHKKSKTERQLEEERRMFYVAVTRASEKLFIYSPKRRGEKDTEMSRYIAEMQ